MVIFVYEGYFSCKFMAVFYLSAWDFSWFLHFFLMILVYKVTELSMQALQ